MLNAGYSTLDYLKRQIFPDVMKDDEEWDEDLKRIGLAVAVQFARFCNREFDRAVGTIHEESANRDSVALPRYPVEVITTVQHICMGVAETLTDIIEHTRLRSGVVEFTYVIGTYKETVKITYTGGYWLDDGEEMPDGATPLPADILNAFVIQVQAVVKATDVLRNGAVKADEETMALAGLKLIPMVEEVLKPYRRYS
jgi:hypothetical protein